MAQTAHTDSELPSIPTQDQRQEALGRSFSPSSPINDAALFSGRAALRRDINMAVAQRGQHVLLYGERGVGKTSLSNIVLKKFSVEPGYVSARVNCDKSDTFSAAWRKIFDEIAFTVSKQAVGFNAAVGQSVIRLSEQLPADRDVQPNDVRRLLGGIGVNFVLIFDEFDRINPAHTSLFADTIKSLSDHDVPTTLVLVGVADSVDALLSEHASVERALVQVQTPRMFDDELRDIVVSGLARAQMTIEDKALSTIVRLSQGLPHYTHLLAQNAAFACNDAGRTQVESSDVEGAIAKAVEKASASIRSAHHKAISSPRKDNLFGRVLLACALAKADQLGYFAPSDVRDPMSAIMGREYGIPSFAQHLNDFCGEARGRVLQRTGDRRRYRFRFVNPLMQPFVIMNGMASGLVPKDLLSAK